jgi:peptidoglycan hydrolase-like protein with peptidoglycan-binding domain
MIAMNKKYMKLAALAAIAVGGYLVIRNLLGKSSAPTTEAPTPNEPSKILTQDFPIKKGSKGEKVREIQTLLVGIDTNALPKYGIDGDFGSETEAALFKYTKKKSVDNQDDLSNLIGLKDAAQSSALQGSIDANRSVAANQIINDWRLNSSKSIFAKSEVQYAIGGLTFSGAETNLSTRVAKAGNKIVNGFEIKDMSILPSGFLKITTTGGGLNGGFIKVSPFAIVLK